MTLLDIIKLLDDEAYPPTVDKDFGINSIPLSSIEITVCFMCEEETWLTCNIQNEILIPWYDCEVKALDTTINEDNTSPRIAVWLKDEEYLFRNFPHHFRR